jgi:light-regulated signal transduction histidine kinase (bacteriophytochrome)
MDTIEEAPMQVAETRPGADVGVQAGACLLELSSDWIVLRASENVHRVLGESHVTLIDEPLGRFVHSDALHDVRNLFSRLSGTLRVARAYRIRLTDDPDLFDIAFQLSDERVLIEVVPSTGAFGEAFGTVAGLVAGLAKSGGQALLDAGARRMRALTGYDRVTLRVGNRIAESSRGAFAGAGQPIRDLPIFVSDTEAAAVPVFPRADDDSAASALMKSPSDGQCEQLRRDGIRAILRVPFDGDGHSGEFRCDSRTARAPSFELHAAAELFAQMFATRLEIDRMKSG